MFRTSRTIASLIRHLTFGTAAIVATATLATTLVGCKDESQPDYWVDKLQDPKWRPRAVKRLDQFFQDGLTRAGEKQFEDPEVKALLDKVVEPLSQAYVDGYSDLDTKTRVNLIKLLASFRDKRAEPAMKKALEEFAQRPKEKKEEEDIKWVIRAQTDMKLPSLNPLVMEVFQKMKAHTMLGGVTYKDLNRCMLEVADPAWLEPLKKMLEAEVTKPDNVRDKAYPDYLDQQFWQLTAAQVLGKIGDASAVRPLIKVMLDPQKLGWQTEAILALVMIGKPSMDAAVKLIKGEDDDLVKYHQTRYMKATKESKPPKDDPHVAIAAQILGLGGRKDSIQPMLEAYRSQKVEANKVAILNWMAYVPETEASEAAFKEHVQNAKPNDQTLPELLPAVARFYDPEWVPILIAKANEKGSDDVLKTTVMTIVLKLASPKQASLVSKVVKDWGGILEKEVQVERKDYSVKKTLEDPIIQLFKECGDRVPCYLSKIESAELQKKGAAMGGIKCAYMLGMLGDESTAGEIVKRMDAIEEIEVRATAAFAVDHLLPNGSESVAADIQKTIEKNEEKGDDYWKTADKPLKQVMVRLRARAKK